MTERAKTAGHQSPAFAALLLCLPLAACQTGQGRSETSALIQTSTAGALGGAVNQMDFFDALEQRSEVTWDELLAGVALAAGKPAGASYAERVAWAQRNGLLGTDAPDHGAMRATAADLARLLLRAQGVRLHAGISGGEVVALAVRRSLLPNSVGPGDPLTGPLTVAALSAVGRPAPSAAASSTVRTGGQTKPTAAAGASPGSRGGSEP